MGMAGPLVCYQVESSVKTKARSDFEHLRSVATILDANPPRVHYSLLYPAHAPRYAHRNGSGTIPVYVEKNASMRPTLLHLLQSISPQFLGILVPDIDDFLDCDPYLAATVAKMNLSFGLQILSLQVRTKGKLVEDHSLTPENLSSNQGQALEDLLWANSLACQKKSETKLGRLATSENLEIRRLRKMSIHDATNLRLLALLKVHDEGFNVSRPVPREYAPFDRARSPRYGR